MRLHSSEKIGLRSIKMSSQMLLSNFTFPLMNALVYVNIYQGPGHSIAYKTTVRCSGGHFRNCPFWAGLAGWDLASPKRDML